MARDENGGGGKIRDAGDEVRRAEEKRASAAERAEDQARGHEERDGGEGYESASFVFNG